MISADNTTAKTDHKEHLNTCTNLLWYSCCHRPHRVCMCVLLCFYFSEYTRSHRDS